MTVPRRRRRTPGQRYERWKADEFAYSIWKLGSDQLAEEQAVIQQLTSQRPWEELSEWEDMPYRPPRHTCRNEWPEQERADHLLEHLCGLCPPHLSEKEQKEQENDMARMTRERMAILSALEEAGGFVEDASGSATAKLAELVGKDSTPGTLRPFNGTLQRMEQEGLIVRTKPTPSSKRTTRIALPDAGYDFRELTQALKDLGGRVEQNGEDAATLLRDVMQYEGSKKAFRDLLSMADREGAIVIDRTGNRIHSISLPEAVDSAIVNEVVIDNAIEDLSVEMSEAFDRETAPEPGEYGYEESETFVETEDAPAMPQSDEELQRFAGFLVDEVVRRASAPAGVSETEIENLVAQRTGELEAKLDAAARTLVDRMNQLDDANRRIAELEVEVTRLDVLVKNANIENERISKELGRRPVGPKVSETVSDDSRRQLENFRKLMQEKPTTK